jgi:hypothetical protein
MSKLSILCFPGYGTNGKFFKYQMKQIEKALEETY